MTSGGILFLTSPCSRAPLRFCTRLRKHIQVQLFIEHGQFAPRCAPYKFTGQRQQDAVVPGCVIAQRLA